MSTKESYKRLLIIVGVFLILSFGFWLINHDSLGITGDTGSYVLLAEKILNGTIGEGYTSRTPGYPLFLGMVFALGGNYDSVIVLQILFSAFCIVLAYKTCRNMGAGENLSNICCLAFALDFSLYLHQCYVVSDVFFLNVLVVTLFFLSKYYKERKTVWFMFFSLSLNFALLVRPILIYYNFLLFVLLLFLAILRKTNWRNFFLYCLVFMVLIGGWCLRNYHAYGIFEYNSIRNVNLLMYDGAELRADIEGISREEAQEKFLEEFNKEHNTTGLNQAEIIKLQGKFGSRYIKNHFGRYIIQNIKGFIKELFGPNNKFLSETINNNILRYAFILLYCSYLGLVYLLYVYGFFKNIRTFNFVDWFIFTVSGYCAAASASLGYARFRVAWFGIILIGAFLFVSRIKKGIRS